MDDSNFTEDPSKYVVDTAARVDADAPAPEVEQNVPLGLNEQQELVKRGVIFTELMNSERFVQFIQCNFDFATVIDDETKSITFSVVEVPPTEVMRRVAAMTVRKDKENPQIQIASNADLKKIDAAAKKAGVIK